MAKRKYKYKYNTLEKWSTKRLENYIKKQVKTANYGLSALESKNMQESSTAYRYIQREASKNKNKSFLRVNKNGSLRISSATKGLTKQELARRAYEIQNYNRAKTSNVKGVRASYKKGYETFKKQQKIDLSFEDWSRLWTTAGIDSFKKNYYATFSRMIKSVKDGKSNVNYIMNLIEQYGEGRDGDEIVQEYGFDSIDTDFELMFE